MPLKDTMANSTDLGASRNSLFWDCTICWGLHVSDTLECDNLVQQYISPQSEIGEAWWPCGRALDSGARGRGFDPHSCLRIVSLSKIHLPPKKVLVIPRKWWLRPDMTEKLLTGT